MRSAADAPAAAGPADAPCAKSKSRLKKEAKAAKKAEAKAAARAERAAAAAAVASARDASSADAASAKSTPMPLALAGDDDAAAEIERRHVRAVYNAIAEQWHGTRYRSWPRVEEFVLTLPRAHSLVADIGCGNGKMASACARARHYAIGADSSIELVRICARCARMQSVVADALELPYRDGVFDAGTLG